MSPLLRFALTSVVVTLGAAAALAVLPTGCNAQTATKPSASRCTPGNYVFCRCADRMDGTKLCLEDGNSFGKCEPCETDENPEIEEEGPEPRPVVDSGKQPAARCGDAIPQDGEACDDGNEVDDDGCDSDCKLSGSNPLTSRSCPGMTVHVWGPPVTWSSTTASSTNTGSVTPTCGTADGNIPTSGSAASDRVLAVTAHRTGTMTVATTDTDYNSFLYVAESCTTGANAYLQCANKKDGVGGETMTFPVTDGKSYTVFVDGAGISGHQGVFRVTLSIQ